MMKILFVIPPKNFRKEKNFENRVFDVEFPLGVLSIIEYIEKFCVGKVETDILDLGMPKYQNLSEEEIHDVLEQAIEAFKPDVIGASVLFNTDLEVAVQLCQKVKQINRDIWTIVGGNCATLLYSEMLQSDSVDATCYSEGEIPWRDIVEDNDVYTTIENHKSFVTKKKLERGFTPQESFVEDLDDIPPIDFNRVDIGQYRTRRRSILFNPDFENVDFPMITTRGCPFNCVFCTAKALHGKKVRHMSAERVIADAKILKEKFGANSINIMDDQALIYKDRAKQMLNGFAELDLIPAFTNGVNISMLDEELLDCMKKANVNDLSLALESGSEFVLKNIIDKPLNIEMVGDVIEKCRERNILAQAFLVVGLPGEEKHHRKETEDFIKKTGFDWVTISCASPIKGSRLHDICVERGYINKEHYSQIGKNLSKSMISTESFTAEEITEEAYLMNLKLNFLENYNLKIGNFSFILEKMNYILDKYPNHAVAHYVKSVVYERIDEKELAEASRVAFLDIVNADEKWKRYCEKLSI